MTTKKTATQKVVSKEESLFKEEKAVKTSKSSAKKPVEKALKVTRKTTKKAEKVEQPKAEEPKAEPKKEVKKTAIKKTPAKKAVVKKAEKKENPMDKMFPKTIEVEGTTFERHEELTSWEDFKALTEDNFAKGIHTVVASNWPKKFAKDYNNNCGMKLFPKEGFAYDLDLNEVLIAQQTIERVITVSILTESAGFFSEEDFSNLTEFGYFMTNEMPFCVYTYEDVE